MKVKTTFDLIEYLDDKYRWSIKTFGPGERTKGIVNHIKKELDEILASPKDLEEWCDVIILALDGARREGYNSEAICKGLVSKLQKNKNRQWPDWRQFTNGEAIEHIRKKDESYGVMPRSERLSNGS